MKVRGSCHCGAIRFEALTGSAFSLFLRVPKEAFRLTAGETQGA